MIYEDIRKLQRQSSTCLKAIETFINERKREPYEGTTEYDYDTDSSGQLNFCVPDVSDANLLCKVISDATHDQYFASNYHHIDKGKNQQEKINWLINNGFKFEASPNHEGSFFTNRVRIKPRTGLRIKNIPPLLAALDECFENDATGIFAKLEIKKDKITTPPISGEDTQTHQPSQATATPDSSWAAQFTGDLTGRISPLTEISPDRFRGTITPPQR